MANTSDDAEFDKENNKNGLNATTELDAEFGFPSEFPYEFDSFGIPPLDSPVESLAGSTETESSDEEDFFAGLTRRLSQASLQETRLSQLTVPINKTEIQKDRVISGSPQSTLSGIGSWSGWSSGSGDGSPNGSSRVPSPSTTAFSGDAWETIYAAAGHVARLKMNDDVSRIDFHNRGVTRGLPPHVASENRASALFTNRNLDLASQVRMRQEQMLKQQCGSVWGREPKATFSTQQELQVQNKGREFGYGSVKCALPLPQSAWHPLQAKHQNQQAQVQHGGSGCRPVLHGGSGVKRGCAGTGVFLPRQYVAPPESRKKTSCAPPLLPAKVIHALNLNIDDLNATSQPRFSSAYGVDYNALLARRNAIMMQHKLSLRRGEAASYEIRLPQEWTY